MFFFALQWGKKVQLHYINARTCANCPLKNVTNIKNLIKKKINKNKCSFNNVMHQFLIYTCELQITDKWIYKDR